MTEQYMTGNTFALELITAGVEIPTSTTEIIIEIGAQLEKANIFFIVQDIKSETATKVMGALPFEMTSLEFFNALREKINLPEGTSSLVIHAKIGEVVNVHLAAALPQGAIDFIKVTENEVTPVVDKPVVEKKEKKKPRTN